MCLYSKHHFFWNRIYFLAVDCPPPSTYFAVCVRGAKRNNYDCDNCVHRRRKEEEVSWGNEANDVNILN